MADHTYTVFAITASAIDGDDPLVFVGKTTQTDLQAVLRYHRKHNYYARPVFEEGTDICIHALDTVTGSASDAYRYVLAYMRYFLETGLDVVSHYKPYESCLDLSSETQRILDMISDKSLDDILEPSSSTTKPIPSSQNSLVKKGPLTSRLSIRISKREYEEYCSFCQALQVSQRDGLLTLLAQNNSAKSILAQRLQEQAQTISQQKKHIQHLDFILENGSRGANADKKIVNALLLCQRGIYQYIRHLFNDKTLPLPLPCLSWKNYKLQYKDWAVFESPENETPFYFQLQRLCYSTGPNSCIFLFGVNPCTGQKLRLRYYDKRVYIGPHPTRSPYFFEGALFLMVCKRDSHGAADVLIGLPIPETPLPAEQQSKHDTFESLNNILSNAMARSLQNNNRW